MARPSTILAPALGFASLVALAATAAPLQAEEGMWTLDNFPAAKVRAEYGWAPDKAWLDRVQAAAVRLTGGWLGRLRLAAGADSHQPALRRELHVRQFDRRERSARQGLHRCPP